MTTDGEILTEEDRAAMVVGHCNGANLLNAWAAKRPRMTLNQFSSFAAVAKHLSLTKASAELRVSQPSLSLQLKQLEDHHGAKIYRRVSKGVEITEAGQVLLRMVIPILEQVARLERGFKKTVGIVAPERLAVGGTFSASAALLPGLLARLGRQNPRADLELQTNSSEQLERLVLSSALDLAVIDHKATKDLKCEPLRREEVVVFVPAGHRLASRAKVNLSDLLAEPLIIRGGKGISGTTEKMFRRLREQGQPVNIALRCEGPAAVKAAVRQGMGVGVAFEDVIRDEIESGEFNAIRVRGLRLKAKSFIVYSKKRPLSPLAQEFLKLLCEARTEALRSKVKSKVRVQVENQSRSALRMKIENDARVNLPAIAATPELPAGQFATFPAEAVSTSVPSRTAATTTLLFGFLAQPFLLNLQMINAF